MSDHRTLLSGTALNIVGLAAGVVAAFGVQILIGVVVNIGIVLVAHINELRSNGMERMAAIVQAGRDRLRPILMTTLAIIAGMLPVALGRGDGAASRASLATVVVGGQALCLLVTLLITPVIYSTFDDMRGLKAFSGLRFPRWKAALAGRLAWGQPLERR